jgi:anti-sigma regulatory factor (Ser/Thr protein kinase)
VFEPFLVVAVGYARDIDAELDLPSTPKSVYQAREFVTRVLRGWPGDADAARLLTSELVTNTVVHTSSALALRVHRAGGRVRIEVADHEASVPMPTSVGRDAENGRGLNIVATMASAWGVDPLADGKVVWFELAR